MDEDKDLKKQLDGLFTGLLDEEAGPSTALAATELPADQLDRLFSDPPPLAQPPRPPPSVGTPPAGQTTPDHQRTLPPALDTPSLADQDRLLQLLKSREAKHRHYAVQQLTQIQSKWTIEPLLRAAADSDPEIATLALTALLRLDEMVKRRVLALAQHPLTPLLHRGSEAYLSHLLGQPFVYIPFGPFQMGSHAGVDEMANPNEQPQHVIHLAGYWISRYPVTAARYRTFVAQTQHESRGDGYRRTPDNQPAVDVTWQDALAYCHWLSQRSGLPVHLPSEAEWEKAARGTDGRRYPWGNQQPTPELCNFQNATPVGQYSPQGDSPYGCADMAGNVWEWTRSIYKPYPYNPRDGREIPEGDEARVIRGLTFNNAERFTRCAFRYNLVPHLHLDHLGFRVVVAPN